MSIANESGKLNLDGSEPVYWPPEMDNTYAVESAHSETMNFGTPLK